MAGSEAEGSASALVDFVAGTMGGIASLLAGHPFDTVKTRLQAQPASVSGVASLVSEQGNMAVESSHGGGAGGGGSKVGRVPKRSSTSVGQYLSTCSGAVPKWGEALTPRVETGTGAAGAGAGVGVGGAGRMASVTFPVYRSATDAFRIIVRHERIWGLYKGVTSPMLGVALMNASIFGMYNLSLQLQSSYSILTTHPLAQVFVAGMLSGVATSLITSPIELVKIREQMNPTMASKGSGTSGHATWKTFRSILHNQGLFRGLYRGWCTTAIRDLGYGPYFATYQLLNSQIQHLTGQPLSNVDMAASGAIAGVVAWLSTFWADVIKTKIQASSHYNDPTISNIHPTRTRPSLHSSLFWSTARHTYTQAGWSAFFVGLGPTILRALPVNAVLFVSYELTKDYLVSHGY